MCPGGIGRGVEGGGLREVIGAHGCVAAIASLPGIFSYLGWGLNATHLPVLKPLPRTATQFLRCTRKVYKVGKLVIEFVLSRDNGAKRRFWKHLIFFM